MRNMAGMIADAACLAVRREARQMGRVYRVRDVRALIDGAGPQASGSPGDDAKHYQLRAVRLAIEESKK
jgi:hypothetical protein